MVEGGDSVPPSPSQSTVQLQAPTPSPTESPLPPPLPFNHPPIHQIFPSQGRLGPVVLPAVVKEEKMKPWEQKHRMYWRVLTAQPLTTAATPHLLCSALLLTLV